MRVVVTHIGQDGTMLRRVVDTACCTDGPQWADLATRALRLPPSYHAIPGTPVYHVSVDNRMVALAAEHDLWGPLLDLVIAVLAMGDEVLEHPAYQGHGVRPPETWDMPWSGV